ncbi:helix-turn-helix domain-containing protein [Paracoccaceae bacterium GXU_MW_L88]
MRALKTRRITLSSIAEEAGCSLSMASMVSQGYRSSRLIEGLIARKLDTSPMALWPDRYHDTTSQEVKP